MKRTHDNHATTSFAARPAGRGLLGACIACLLAAGIAMLWACDASAAPSTPPAAAVGSSPAPERRMPEGQEPADAIAAHPVDPAHVFPLPQLKPVDSSLKIRVGDTAPDFDLPAVDGTRVRLSGYRGKAIVVLSFVPAAFTPVCSAQWPGYEMLRTRFERLGATIIGITTDNVPSLFAWTSEMGTDAAGKPTGLWFPVVSDFWPHGEVTDRYGLLRRDGTADRAFVVVDREGIVRFIEVGDINQRPSLGNLLRTLEQLAAPR